MAKKKTHYNTAIAVKRRNALNWFDESHSVIMVTTEKDAEGSWCILIGAKNPKKARELIGDEVEGVKILYKKMGSVVSYKLAQEVKNKYQFQWIEIAGVVCVSTDKDDSGSYSIVIDVIGDLKKMKSLIGDEVEGVPIRYEESGGIGFAKKRAKKKAKKKAETAVAL